VHEENIVINKIPLQLRIHGVSNREIFWSTCARYLEGSGITQGIVWKRRGSHSLGCVGLRGKRAGGLELL